MSLKQQFNSLNRIKSKKGKIVHVLVAKGEEGFEELISLVKNNHSYLTANTSAHYAVKIESHRKGRVNLLGVILYGYTAGGRGTKSWTGVEGNRSVLEVTGVGIYGKVHQALTNANEFMLDYFLTVNAIVALPKADDKKAVHVFNPRMKYYGISEPRKDFYKVEGSDGEFSVNNGKTKDVAGVWLPRVARLRFAQLVHDDVTVGSYDPIDIPHEAVPCCNGTHKVKDARTGVTYTCPKCTGVLRRISQPIEEL